MSTKTLTITSEAYERLAAHKRDRESFTDVINRLTRKNTILELAGTITKEEGEKLKTAIADLRKHMDDDFTRKMR